MTASAQNGFTLIELVMVILLLSVLAAVAIPNYIDMRTDAKNAATKGGLGGLRSSILIAVAAIALREDPSLSPPKYPTYAEFSANVFNGSHPVLSGTFFMENATGFPDNPWTRSSATAAERKNIYDCNGIAKAGLLTFGNADRGWCYKETTGEIWPNSDNNGSGGTLTENYY